MIESRSLNDQGLRGEEVPHWKMVRSTEEGGVVRPLKVNWLQSLNWLSLVITRVDV